MLRLALLLASLLLPSICLAVPITNPGLASGTQYRLAFITSGTTTATSTDITTYDDFVQSAADAVPELLALGTTWQVIGSTATVDAIDHTGTGTGLGSTVPIYLLDAQLLVIKGLDLWNDDLFTEFSTNEDGQSAPGPGVAAWTGTGTSGAGINGCELGGLSCSFTGDDPGVIFGEPETGGWGWVFVGGAGGEAPASLYALSDVLTVPAPEPRSTALLTLAFVALLLMRRARTT